MTSRMLMSMGDVNIIQTYFLRSLGDPKTLVEIIEKRMLMTSVT